MLMFDRFSTQRDPGYVQSGTEVPQQIAEVVALIPDRVQYRSYKEQTLSYFDRSHDGAPTRMVDSHANWMGAQLRDAVDDWRYELDDAQVAELSAAADRLMGMGVALEDVSRHNFEIPGLKRLIARWADELDSGLGFQVVRGLPVAEWGQEKSAFVFWGISHHLGLPGAQNATEDLLGHVRVEGCADEFLGSEYRTNNEISFHSDAADAVGMLCLSAAQSGGTSRIVSSVAVFNAMLARNPELAARMFEPFPLDRREEQSVSPLGYISVQPLCYGDDGMLRSFYNGEYFRSAVRHTGAWIDEAGLQALALYDQLCEDPNRYLELELEPGDMQFLSNHSVLHSRTAFEDGPEKSQQRHLLRLWLSI